MRRRGIAAAAVLAAWAVLGGGMVRGEEVISVEEPVRMEETEALWEAELREGEIVILEEVPGDGSQAEGTAGASQNGGTAGTSTNSQEGGAADSAQDASAAGNILVEEIETLEGAEPETESGMVAGYQFADGYGICGPDSPAVYVVAAGADSTYETGAFSLTLTGGLYQQGKLRLSLLLEDYTVELLDEEETARYLEQKRINQEKQERGEAVEWDWSRFCMDEEKQIYAHSSLRENEPGGGEFRLRGAEGSGYGYFAKSASSSTAGSYEEYLERGCVSTWIELEMWQTAGDDRMPGEGCTLLEEELGASIPITFERALEVSSLEEIPGMERSGEFYTLVQKEQVEEDLTQVSVYLYSLGEETLDGCMVSVTEGETILEAVPYGKSGAGLEYAAAYFESFLPGAWFRGRYRLPEEGAVARITPYLGSELSFGEIHVPAAENAAALNVELDLPDCRIHLTGVEPGERRTVGWNKGAITARTLLITGTVESGAKDRKIQTLLGQKKGALYSGPVYGNVQEDGTLRLTVTWEEGEQDVVFTLDHLISRQNEEILCPL